MKASKGLALMKGAPRMPVYLCYGASSRHELPAFQRAFLLGVQQRRHRIAFYRIAFRQPASSYMLSSDDLTRC